jgi:hypothetical protein
VAALAQNEMKAKAGMPWLVRLTAELGVGSHCTAALQVDWVLVSVTKPQVKRAPEHRSEDVGGRIENNEEIQFRGSERYQLQKDKGED